MGFLDESGVTALWNKIKANFGRKLTISNTTITLQNGAATPTNLSQVTIPNATTSTPGAMSAADKAKLEGLENYEHPTGNGNNHVPAGGSAGQVLQWDSLGTAKWGNDSGNTTYDFAAPASKTNGNVTLDLKAGGSGSGTDSVTVKGTGGTSVTTDASGVVTIDSKAYSHPGYTAQAGVPTGNQTPAFGGTFNVGQTVSDSSGHVTAVTSRTVTIPATIASLAGPGLMSVDMYSNLTNDHEIIGDSGLAALDSEGETVQSYVANQIALAQVGAAMYKGAVTSNNTISSSEYKTGWYWVVSTAGTYVGESCEAGDMIFARNNKGSAYAASDFDVIQNNIVALTTAEVEAICVV